LKIINPILIWSLDNRSLINQSPYVHSNCHLLRTTCQIHRKRLIFPQCTCVDGSLNCPFHWITYRIYRTHTVFRLQIRSLSVANKSSGGMSASKSEASSGTVLYTLMTFKATAYWCLIRLSLFLVIFIAVGAQTKAAYIIWMWTTVPISFILHWQDPPIFGISLANNVVDLAVLEAIGSIGL